MALVAISLAVPSAYADQIFVNLSGDTWMNVDTNNNSASTHLATYTWPVGQVANASILKWDLSSIPSGSTINHATLSLYLQDWRGPVPYHVTVHRIINVNPVIAAATGETYDGTNSWTPNNCCAFGTPLAQADIAAYAHLLSVTEVLGYKSWHVTTIVQQWINDPATVFGVLVNSDHSAAIGNYRFFASNESYTDRRPLLEVNFTAPGSPPPPAPAPSHRTVTLTWVDNSNNEEGFYVERRQYPPEGAFVRDATVGFDVTTYSQTFAAMEARCYRVQAFNATGNSEYTNEACACVNFICSTGVVARPPVTNRPPVTSRPPVP